LRKINYFCFSKQAKFDFIAKKNPVVRDDMSKLGSLLDSFSTVTLNELSGNLQDRYDEKYLIPVAEYRKLLEQLTDDYRVLDVDGIRQYQYVSSYLDLPGFPFFLAHHNGRKDRYKVRYRRYVHSGKVFLEVKHKINKGKTLKKRMATDRESEHPRGKEISFLRENTPFDPLQMSRVLQASFSRITLASPTGDERITYDHDLLFRAGDREVQLPGFGVMEIKHSGRKLSSPMTALLLRYGITPGGFSKYCTGIALLYPGIKYNRFKPLILSLKKKKYVTASTNNNCC
jgi:hypothetical protein